jgi:hypothetical protein
MWALREELLDLLIDILRGSEALSEIGRIGAGLGLAGLAEEFKSAQKVIGELPCNILADYVASGGTRGRPGCVAAAAVIVAINNTAKEERQRTLKLLEDAVTLVGNEVSFI